MKKLVVSLSFPPTCYQFGSSSFEDHNMCPTVTDETTTTRSWPSAFTVSCDGTTTIASGTDMLLKTSWHSKSTGVRSVSNKHEPLYPSFLFYAQRPIQHKIFRRMRPNEQIVPHFACQMRQKRVRGALNKNLLVGSCRLFPKRQIGAVSLFHLRLQIFDCTSPLRYWFDHVLHNSWTDRHIWWLNISSASSAEDYLLTSCISSFPGHWENKSTVMPSG